MQTIKRVVAYTMLALSVTVGGVIIGATVIAPAIGSRKAVVMGYNSQPAPVAPAVVAPAVVAPAIVAPAVVAPVAAPVVAATVAPKTPAQMLAAVTAAAAAPAGQAVATSETVTSELAAAPDILVEQSTLSALKERAMNALKSARVAMKTGSNNAIAFVTGFAASRRMPQLPANVWLAIAISSTLIVLSLIGWRVRASRMTRRGPISSPIMAQTSKSNASIVVAASTKLPGMSAVSSRLTGRIDRTPRAVVALAESGAAPAEIARRTGMPLDAVAMCLSMYQMGVRQLQPPTA